MPRFYQLFWPSLQGAFQNCNQISQARLQSTPNTLREFLGFENGGKKRKDRFYQHPLIPLSFAAQLEIRRVNLAGGIGVKAAVA